MLQAQEDISQALRENTIYNVSHNVNTNKLAQRERLHKQYVEKARFECMSVNQPLGGSAATYQYSLSYSSAACTPVDRYTHNSPVCWRNRIYNLHDLYCTRRYLWREVLT